MGKLPTENGDGADSDISDSLSYLTTDIHYRPNVTGGHNQSKRGPFTTQRTISTGACWGLAGKGMGPRNRHRLHSG